MRRLVPLLASAFLGVFAAGSPAGAEPARFAIMGVRLYMSAEEVLTTLYAQGVKPDAVTENVHPCALHAAVACTMRITAPLTDGVIDVRFTDAPAGFSTGREAAMAVSYKLTREHPETDTVRLAAEERFGTLRDGGGQSAGGQDAAGGVWCAPSASPNCPEDQPRMSVVSPPSGAVVLKMTDLGLPARLAPEMPR